MLDKSVDDDNYFKVTFDPKYIYASYQFNERYYVNREDADTEQNIDLFYKVNRCC